MRNSAAAKAVAASLCIVAALWTAANVRRHHLKTHLESTVPWRIVDDWPSFANNGHRIGPAGADVVVVAFIDYECPACRDFARRLRALRERYPLSLAAIIRHYPLTSHAHATTAAVAIECAAAQGEFESLHRRLLQLGNEVGEWTWASHAEEASLPEVGAFMRCLETANPDSLLRADLLDARRLGVSATPTLLVCNHAYEGLPWDFERIVERFVLEDHGCPKPDN